MPIHETTVQDVMTKDVQTVLPEVPVIRAAQIMTQHQIRHLVVIDPLGPVVGVVTQRQVLKHFSPWLSEANLGTKTQASPPSLEVRNIMSQPPITATPESPIRTAADVMASEKIGCLPVVKGGKCLVGIVTTIDVLRFIAGNQSSHGNEEFHVYMPPAFLSKDREFILPAGYFPDAKLEEGLLAILSYAPKGKRIGVRLCVRSHQEEVLLGARPAGTTDKYVTIPAADFLDYYNLNIRGPLEITQTETSGYVILSPILSPTFRNSTDHAELAQQ